MSIPLGPQTGSVDCCNRAPGTYPPPDIAPYVVSLNDLNGIITLDGQGAIDITSSGNTILFSLSAAAGLGTVTSVGLSSTSLTVANTPVTTAGTITVNLTGATASIQNLVTAADKMIYTTASNVYATTDLTAFARTLLDDAAAVNARSTLGLVIGTNVQAWSADLDSFVSTASFSGSDLTFAGSITLTSGGEFTAVGASLDEIACNNINATAAITAAGNITSSGGVFSGNGSSLTTLNASNLSSGTTAVARGGTGIASYTTGDLLYASGATTLSKLVDVGAGAYLRSGGVAAAPVWSSITLPNALTTGDLLYASNSVAVNRLTAVATGNALISGGVTTAPSWGKITASHTTGLAASGVNSDITSLDALTAISSDVQMDGYLQLNDILYDSTASEGNFGAVLTSLTTGVQWSTQLNLSALNLSAYLTLSGTITAAGTTGARTINKPSGSVNFAAAATSLVVTNSLCTANSIIVATVASNDATMSAAKAVPTSGSFTLYPDTAPTAETSVRWILINPT